MAFRFSPLREGPGRLRRGQGDDWSLTEDWSWMIKNQPWSIFISLQGKNQESWFAISDMRIMICGMNQSKDATYCLALCHWVNADGNERTCNEKRFLVDDEVDEWQVTGDKNQKSTLKHIYFASGQISRIAIRDMWYANHEKNQSHYVTDHIASYHWTDAKGNEGSGYKIGHRYYEQTIKYICILKMVFFIYLLFQPCGKTTGSLQ